MKGNLAVKADVPPVYEPVQSVTDPRIVDGIEQRSSLYGLLVVKDKVRWEAAPAAQFHAGVVTRPAG
jgi:hypothetical protein